MRENLLLDLMEFKDWDLTKQFAVARSKVKQFYGLAFLPNLPAPRWNRSFKILLPLTESFPNFQLPPQKELFQKIRNCTLKSILVEFVRKL